MSAFTGTRDCSPEVETAIRAACDRIAPTWPLDRFIAVNPYWGWRSSRIETAAARLGALAGTRLTMPYSWFIEQWQSGTLTSAHLDAAASMLGDPDSAGLAHRLLDADGARAESTVPRLPLVTDLRDRKDFPRPGQSWTEHVVHHIGQHCASSFDHWQGSWQREHRSKLFVSWRMQPVGALGVRWQSGADAIEGLLTRLPDDPRIAIDGMLEDLGIPRSGHEAYLTALLLSVNGWAAWCAYERWQARLADSDDDSIVDLLAIRLAWEWLIASEMPSDPAGPDSSWTRLWATPEEVATRIATEQRIDWVLQTGVELAHQETVIDGLARSASTSVSAPTPAVQAVFCIDVRSEVIRRAFESESPVVHTRGFAGFFGLPIAYSPLGSSLARPQLPGLLGPTLTAVETTVSADTGRDPGAARRARLAAKGRWSRFRSAPASIFSFVESMGLVYSAKLLKESLPHSHAPRAWEYDGLDASTAASLRPRLGLVREDPAAAAAIGKRVLTAMGLTEGFAPIVMLCGHGSRTANNPHAAGLDCGACGGQTGEVNARVLADLLNAPEVRSQLTGLGITIPPSTWFLPALHNTTTDEIQLFDTDLAPESALAGIGALRQWASAAGRRARAERAESLGLGELADDPSRLESSILERSCDWSQVRPEWGLAGNASFIVAPRDRTRHMNLTGRTFLHDYDWRTDLDLSVLTLIMTAPMVVTNWINMQYYASTVDNQRYGSGNKVLHNVVGGRLGVFEGNGGDLRVGLSMQSLHDGVTLRHPPLRLSVFIEAPRDSIDSIISDHQVVADLVANGWLHLLRIESGNGSVERRTAEGWLNGG